MLLRGINDDILIPHPYYSSVHQDEAKNESSTKRVGTKPKNWQNGGELRIK